MDEISTGLVRNEKAAGFQMGTHRSHDGGCGKREEGDSENRIQKGVAYLYITRYMGNEDSDSR